MFIVYVGSDKIRIVEGSASPFGGKIKIKSLFSALMPNDYLDNPNEKAFLEVSNVIAQGLSEIGGNTKKVKVVLENGTIPFTEKEVVSVAPLKIVNLIKNEIFSDEKLASSIVVDFIETERYLKEEKIKIQRSEKWDEFLGKKPAKKDDSEESQEKGSKAEDVKIKKVKTSRIFFTYVSKNVLKHFDKFFKELGYKLVAVDIYQNALRKLVNSKYKTEKNLPETLLLVEYKEDAITVFLFKNKKFAYTFRKTLALSLDNIRKSVDNVINEISSVIREAMQFFRGKYDGIEFTNIYLTGVLPNFETWKDILSSKLAYDTELFEKPKSILNLDNQEFSEFSGAIAGLLK